MESGVYIAHEVQNISTAYLLMASEIWICPKDLVQYTAGFGPTSLILAKCCLSYDCDRSWPLCWNNVGPLPSTLTQHNGELLVFSWEVRAALHLWAMFIIRVHVTSIGQPAWSSLTIFCSLKASLSNRCSCSIIPQKVAALLNRPTYILKFILQIAMAIFRYRLI